jgi:hypothetical protein
MTTTNIKLKERTNATVTIAKESILNEGEAQTAGISYPFGSDSSGGIKEEDGNVVVFLCKEKYGQIINAYMMNLAEGKIHYEVWDGENSEWISQDSHGLVNICHVDVPCIVPLPNESLDDFPSGYTAGNINDEQCLWLAPSGLTFANLADRFRLRIEVPGNVEASFWDEVLDREWSVSAGITLGLMMDLYIGPVTGFFIENTTWHFPTEVNTDFEEQVIPYKCEVYGWNGSSQSETGTTARELIIDFETQSGELPSEYLRGWLAYRVQVGTTRDSFINTQILGFRPYFRFIQQSGPIKVLKGGGDCFRDFTYAGRYFSRDSITGSNYYWTDLTTLKTFGPLSGYESANFFKVTWKDLYQIDPDDDNAPIGFKELGLVVDLNISLMFKDGTESFSYNTIDLVQVEFASGTKTLDYSTTLLDVNIGSEGGNLQVTFTFKDSEDPPGYAVGQNIAEHLDAKYGGDHSHDIVYSIGFKF